MTVYTAAHWGIYEVGTGTPPALSPWREDPDPNQNTRAQRPSKTKPGCVTLLSSRNSSS